MKKYQTLSQFMIKPLHSRESLTQDTKFDMMYRKLVSKNGIRLVAITEVESAFYYHIKVLSDSQQKKGVDYFYDVVIRFFTDDPTIESQSHLNGYYVQFYSNSPSFIYQYAYLYKQSDFLIQMLYSKLDKETLNNPPTTRNANEKLSYDKSIYCACRFLTNSKTKYLLKNGVTTFKKKNPKEFFKEVQDWQSVRFDQELLNEERKLKKSLDSAKLRKDRKNDKKTTNTSPLIQQEDGSYVRKHSSIHRVLPTKQTSGIKKRNVVKSIVRKNAKKKT